MIHANRFIIIFIHLNLNYRGFTASNMNKKLNSFYFSIIFYDRFSVQVKKKKILLESQKQLTKMNHVVITINIYYSPQPLKVCLYINILLWTFLLLKFITSNPKYFLRMDLFPTKFFSSVSYIFMYLFTPNSNSRI